MANYWGALNDSLDMVENDDTRYDDLTMMKIECKVEHTIPLAKSEYLPCFAAVADGSAVVVAENGGHGWKLKRLKLPSGEELDCTNLDFWPDAVVTVKFNGEETVAVFDSETHKIEFRDLSNLAEIKLTHSTGQHKPAYPCVSEWNRSSLYYADMSVTFSGRVHKLDCSGPKPKPASGRNSFHINLGGATDWCVAEDTFKELIICVDMTSLEGYNLRTGNAEYLLEREQIKGMKGKFRPHGVASDWNHRLYVADAKNKKLHEFYSGDGSYIAPIPVEGLGKVLRMEYCTRAEAMIALCEDEGGIPSIKQISVKQD